MRAIVTRLALAALLVASAVPAQTPREWSLGPTGRGGAQWSERQGRLIYRGGATVGWALVKDAPLRDGFVQVRFRSIGGREDRAGGVIWRWRDPGNYYVARAHALAGNVLAFKVVNAGLAHAARRLCGRRVPGVARRPTTLHGARRRARGPGRGGVLVEGGQRDGVRAVRVRSDVRRGA